MVGGDPDEMCRGAEALERAADAVLAWYAPLFEMVNQRLIERPSRFWKLNEIALAWQDAAAEVCERAHALEDGGRCHPALGTVLGIFGYGFVVTAVGQIAQGDRGAALNTLGVGGEVAGATAILGRGLQVAAGAAGAMVGRSLNLVSAFATVGELVCMTPTSGPTSGGINAVSETRPGYVFGENDFENNSGFSVNCQGPCLQHVG
jgi:hypothetical protein